MASNPAAVKALRLPSLPMGAPFLPSKVHLSLQSLELPSKLT
jgi:hypothetical protein